LPLSVTFWAIAPIERAAAATAIKVFFMEMLQVEQDGLPLCPQFIDTNVALDAAGAGLMNSLEGS
jgi:hypothetical protein